jgi:hypothetical protein
VADGVLRRRKINADRRGRLEGVEDPARTSLHEDGRHRDVRLEAEERRATLYVDVEDLHNEAGGVVGVDAFLRQLAGDFDLELEGEVTEVTAILVARDDRTRWCRGRFLLPRGPRIAGERPDEACRSQHHADQASDCASPTVDKLTHGLCSPTPRLRFPETPLHLDLTGMGCTDPRCRPQLSPTSSSSAPANTYTTATTEQVIDRGGRWALMYPRLPAPNRFCGAPRSSGRRHEHAIARPLPRGTGSASAQHSAPSTPSAVTVSPSPILPSRSSIASLSASSRWITSRAGGRRTTGRSPGGPAPRWRRRADACQRRPLRLTARRRLRPTDRRSSH